MRLIRLLKNDLAKETLEWVDQGIIDMTQAEKICAVYDVDIHQIRQKRFGYHVLMGLGYLFVGLAVITLVGANWDDIPRALRMWGLVLLTMACQGYGIKQYVSGQKDQAAGIFLLGNMFFGASIVLIAQIYHLGEHMPDGIFWWALGCLPFGILIKSPWIMLQTMVLSGIWFFLQVNLGFYPALFPVFILAGLYVLCTGKQSLLLFLMVVAAIGFWIEWSLAQFWRDDRQFDFHAEHVMVSVALFVLAYSVSHWLNKKNTSTARDYGAILSVWSLRFGLILMMAMSFKQPWKELLSARFDHTLSTMVIITLICALACFIAKVSERLKPVSVVTVLYLLTVLAIYLSNTRDHAVYFQIAFNLILVGAGVGLILQGIHKGVSHYFFLGVATVLITAFMRYADLIGDYIGGAVLFMVFAALLLGAARYWKKHHAIEETL